MAPFFSALLSYCSSFMTQVNEEKVSSLPQILDLGISVDFEVF